MEKTLRRLFDYQRFEDNEDLRKIVDSVHARYASRELSMDEMSMVNAAGEPEMSLKHEKEQPRK